MTNRENFQAVAPRPAPMPLGADAAILLQASFDGPEAYAGMAEELGYGRLAMPAEHDIEIIRRQLEGQGAG